VLVGSKASASPPSAPVKHPACYCLLVKWMNIECLVESSFWIDSVDMWQKKNESLVTIYIRCVPHGVCAVQLLLVPQMPRNHC
jgi:hypothetical protein